MIKIREARKKDWEEIMEIYREAISEIYDLPEEEAIEVDKREWKHVPFLERGKLGKLKVLLVAELSGRVIGFIYFFPRGDLVYINDLYVKREWRKKGAGKKLVEACFEWARRKGLRVVKGHSWKGALGFFEKMGFRQTGRVKRAKVTWCEVVKLLE